MEIEVKVAGAAIDESKTIALIMLKPPNQERILVITCSLDNMVSILGTLKSLPIGPKVHDFLIPTLKKLGGEVKKVVITSYDSERDFYNTTLYLDSENGEIKVDFTPTDAIALAVRAQTPICVESDVLEKQGQVPPRPPLPKPPGGGNGHNGDDPDDSPLDDIDWDNAPKV